MKNVELIAEWKAKKQITTKRNKYGNIFCVVDGIKFHSQKEAATYLTFKTMEKFGKITNLKLQPKFFLHVNNIQIATYTADFSFTEKGIYTVVDVKSVATKKDRIYVRNKKHMAAQYGIGITEI
jgi:hypothetical protein